MSRIKNRYPYMTGTVIQTPTAPNPCGYIKLTSVFPRLTQHIIYIPTAESKFEVGNNVKFEGKIFKVNISDGSSGSSGPSNISVLVAQKIKLK